MAATVASGARVEVEFEVWAVLEVSRCMWRACAAGVPPDLGDDRRAPAAWRAGLVVAVDGHPDAGGRSVARVVWNR